MVITLSCFISFSLITLFSCKEDSIPIPKPRAYKRIDIPNYGYRKDSIANFTFDASNISQSFRTKSYDGIWFNIAYPDYKAMLHCTYTSIIEHNLSELLEDNHRFVYSHVLMASDITENPFKNRENNLQGIIYQINGNVATPIQFYATDSINHFIRGSLYYEGTEENGIDSELMEPVSETIKKDIEQMLNTIKWSEHELK